MNYITKLNPVLYDFNDKADRVKFKSGGDGKEIGLLAQEVEAILPNVVLTDDEGKKLINYTALIPVMIDAIKALQKEVEALKNK